MRRRGFLGLLLALPFVPALLAIKKSSDPAVRWANLGHKPTLLDVVNRYKDDSQILPVVEALSQRNPLLQDVVWREDHLPIGHKVTWDTKWHDLSEYI